MSWEDNDKLAEWIELSYRNGVREERERIIKLLEKMDIEIHYTTWFDAQGNIINSITSPETLDRKKVFALIKGENATNFTSSTLPDSQCCNCCKDPVCLGCGDCDDVECQTIKEENKPTECICDPCDSKECECYGKRCEYCKTQD